MTTSTQPVETADAKLFRLTAETQDLLPEHTYKAFMHRVEARESVEEKCELLEDGLREFKRGMA
jgi:hypothetical protein